MIKLLWLFVLFSFQHGISYDVHYVHCDIDEIAVRYEEEVVDVELFNIEIKEKAGWPISKSRIRNIRMQSKWKRQLKSIQVLWRRKKRRKMKKLQS